jgi:glycosyltransferase involved in cell wall biosynthesis
MRVVAILASYNERRFIDGCLEHLHGQGVESYLIDNWSTDDHR